MAELRRSLQQSKVESQFLRGELRKAGGQSANPAHFMEEKIQLLKEVRSCHFWHENSQIQYVYYNTFWDIIEQTLKVSLTRIYLISSVGGEAEAESSGGGAGQSQTPR